MRFIITTLVLTLVAALFAPAGSSRPGRTTMGTTNAGAVSYASCKTDIAAAKPRRC